MTAQSDYTGLILISGPDSPGITAGLMAVLSPFAITILEMDQILTRGRLIQTTLIRLNRDHASAIETDLLAFTEKSGLDLAIDFGEISKEQIAENEIVLTIVSPALTPTAVSTIAKSCAHVQGNIIAIRKLAKKPLTAMEYRVHFAGPIPQLDALAREITVDLVDLKTTVLLQRPYDRHKFGQLVMLDVDSTLITQEVIDQLAIKASVGEEVAAITESAMRGELDFESSLRKRVGLLAGAPASIIDEVRAEITLTPGAKTLITTIHAAGGKVGVVSGGFTNVVDSLAAELGLDFVRANTLEIIDGKITGQLVGPIITRAGKAEALTEFATREGVAMESTIAIGDGANDLDMLELAGLGIAFNAKPAVQEASDISINFPDLAASLHLLGFTSNEIERID